MKVTIQDSRTSVTVEPRDFRVTVSGARGPQGPAGAGSTPGGLTGQILAKASDADYDTEWIDNFAPNVEVYVKNSSGSPMTKGQVVYISGADGTNPTISLAIATSEMGSSKTIGWLKQDLAQGDLGYVITEGLLEGINTNEAGAAGDPIWLSPTTAGGVVYGIANKPSAPNHLVFLGYVLRKQTNNGKVYVKVQNGFELGELHDVYNGAKTTPVGDDALLLRDSADSNLWKRMTWTNALAGVKSHMDTFKSVANGYASLDESGKVPASELPSYVDDVVEVANYAALPGTGETGKIYVTLDTNKCYRWTGSTYVEVSAGGGIDTLTTTGTSGAATLVGSTLNIPQYQGVLTNPVTGTGTAGQVAYFNGTSAVTGSANLAYNDGLNRLTILGGSLATRYLINSTATATYIEFQPSTHQINFTISGTEAARINSSRNFLIGNTDGTGRLTVRGSGTTSATTALLVQNSAASELFKVLDNGAWNFNGDGTITGSGNTFATTSLNVRNSDNNSMIRIRNDNRILLGSDSTSGSFAPMNRLTSGVSNTGQGIIFEINANSTGTDLLFTGSNLTATSGVISNTVYQRNFLPTSGTATLSILTISSIINQTGGANGVTRGLYVNPTLTAAADWRSIETSNNTGYAIYAAGTANSYFGGNVGIGTNTPSKTVSVNGELEATVLRGATVYFRAATDANFYIKYDGGDFLTYRSYATHRWQTYISSYDTRMQLFNTGNLVLQNGGTFTDNGQRLQVIGSTLLRGGGTTSATTALLVQNSTPTELFKVLDNGNANFGTGMYWDNTNGRLGIGTASPTVGLTTSNKSVYILGENSTTALVVRPNASVSSGFNTFEVQGTTGIVQFSVNRNGPVSSSGAITVGGNTIYGPIDITLKNSGGTTLGIIQQTSIFSGSATYGFTSSFSRAFTFSHGIESSGQSTLRGSGTTSATTALLVQNLTPTANFTIRDDGGYAFRGGTVGVAQTGYTTFTNLTTDRTCDANATTVEELADILGTLIEDLKTKGIISA